MLTFFILFILFILVFILLFFLLFSFFDLVSNYSSAVTEPRIVVLVFPRELPAVCPDPLHFLPVCVAGPLRLLRFPFC